ncbi:uncharacterized protein LOC125656781 [Ostrea edulis]|uniref:uncharacterized protein LOC125656781 n=1 Tax=Ostrea edulis TaxID=37623 RepID=UPI0024AFC502|nr:uncharacterized protein LOC125656781 [Ostrea edulis]
MEAVIRRLMQLHTGPQRRQNSPTLTRWSLILASYTKISDVVLDNPRVMAMTAIQLLAINNTTLLLWDRRRQKKREEQVLSQGIEISDPPVTAAQPVPPALTRPDTLVSQTAPAFRYVLPPNTAGQTRTRIRSPPSSPNRMPSPLRLPSPPRLPSPTRLPPPSVVLQPYQQRTVPVVLIGPLRPSKSTASYRRKVEKKRAEGERVKTYTPRVGPNKCGKCGAAKIAPTHRQYFGNWFCQATAEQSYEEWMRAMIARGYTSRKRKAPDDPSEEPPPPVN